MRFHIDENHNIKLLPQSTPLQEHKEMYLVVVRRAVVLVVVRRVVVGREVVVRLLFLEARERYMQDILQQE